MLGAVFGDGRRRPHRPPSGSVLARAGRLLGRITIGVVGLVALAAMAVAGLIWASLPPSGMQVRIDGLAAPVSITLDPDGIPRIRAGSDLDGAAALGFMHARDRMFQMELMRRAASGRLSEVAGPATLRLDRTMRTLGIRMRAEADWAATEPETRQMLDAYAHGVNAWIDARGRFAAPEFVPLGAPEPWTAVDSLLWGKTMALYLGGSWRAEIERSALQARLPPGRDAWPPQDATPRPDARIDDRLELALTRMAAAVPAFPEPFTQPPSASNEWAVDGRQTATGAPLLAGDPHLAFSLPSIWYLARIDVPGRVLAGATAPGVPFMILGHNGQIAWTFTTTGADTQDVYIETVLPDGTYATPDGPRPFVTRTERIRVRGADDDVVTVRETRHGPVMSDLDSAGGPALAVAMAHLAPGDTAAAGLLALNRAATVAAAGDASAMISAPVQNMLVADRLTIGQFTTGRIPLRRAGNGATPVDGADGLHDWTGFAEGEALPRVVSPPSGRLVNANERIAPPDFPVFMGQDWFGDWRARRIRDRLAAGPHTVATFAELQVDPVSAFAVQVLPSLLAVQPLDEASTRALGLLRDWDGAMRADLPQPLLFNAWMQRFEATVLGRASLQSAGTRADFVANALSQDGAAWCDGDCEPLLSQSLRDTVASLTATRGPSPRDWQWGAVHQAVFAHPLLGRLPVIGPLTTARVAQDGDDTTVNRGGMRGDSWTSVHGAGFRGVYDLQDLDRSVFALTPGQSGHPLRGGATSLIERWLQGTTLLLGPRGDAVDDTVELTP